MDRRKQRSAMTLVEVVMVVFVIGLLSAIIVPALNIAAEYRQNSEVAHQLRTAIQAFEMYRSEVGEYPPDKTPAVTPPEMVDYFDYFDIDWWGEENKIGGQWDWDNGYNFDYSVSIHAPSVDGDQLEDLDKMIDDGNLYTGNFRKMTDHYHYILEDD